ncbi:uncharacterized protein VP01_24g7 [Puccinia sorghi]|uniref:DDE Tnp4 domain-containing protein n=1 Tax=Puccinia sorghi TaxID=27349 RepID=A0A0L6V5K2_9BASI|nr:uncharacterized protein VP01_24g7 [Puccinia sorghi]
MNPSEGDMKTMAAIILVTLLLPLAVHSLTRQIPYNDLDLTGANYTIAILRGNLRRCLSILRVPSSTFKFLCTEMIEVKMEPVSKLLSMEEQLAIFLYITGHNKSNTAFWPNHFKVFFRHILHLLVHLAGNFISSPPSDCMSGHITSNPKFLPGRLVILLRPSNREELFNLRHSSLRNVIERTFGVLKHHFKILATTSEYKLEQQYDIVIACCCVHNINILCNGQSDDLFSESNQNSHVVCAQDTQEIYNDQQLLSDQEREEYFFMIIN